MDNILLQLKPYQPYAVPAAIGVVVALVLFLAIRSFASGAPAQKAKKGGSKSVKKETPTTKKPETKKEETKKEPETKPKSETPKNARKDAAKKEASSSPKASAQNDAKSKRKLADQASVDDMLKDEEDVLRRYGNLIESKKK